MPWHIICPAEEDGRLGNYCIIQYSLTVMNTQLILGLTKMQSQRKKGTLELAGTQW